MNRKTREYRWLIPAIIVLAGVLISWWQSQVSELSWWHLIRAWTLLSIPGFGLAMA